MQASQGGTHRQPMRSTPRITDFPPEVIRLILRFITGPSKPRSIDDQSLSNLKYVYSLCCNNSYLYGIFRKQFDSLFLSQKTVIQPAAFARLFGSSLEHISVRSAYHDREDKLFFLQALAKKVSALKSLSVIVHFSGTESTVSADPIVALIKSSEGTLKALELGGSALDFDALVPRIAPHIQNLDTLCLQGLALYGSSSLNGRLLVRLLETTRHSLQRLVLVNINCVSHKEEVAHAIWKKRTALTHLEFDEFPIWFFAGVINASTGLGTVVQHLRFGDGVDSLVDWHEEHYEPNSEFLNSVKRYTASLTHLDAMWTYDCEEPILDSIGRVCRNLNSLSIRLDSAEDIECERLSDERLYLPGLRELRMEFHHSDQVEELVRHFASQLHVLELSQGNLSDSLFGMISSCVNLRDLQFTRDREEPQYVTKGCLDESKALSKDGITKMLNSIGKSLRRFSWQCDIYWVEDIPELYDDQRPRVNAGDGDLSGCALAEALMGNCPDLEYVSVSGLKPYQSSQNEFRHAFELLRKQHRGMVMYLECQSPSWMIDDEIFGTRVFSRRHISENLFLASW